MIVICLFQVNLVMFTTLVNAVSGLRLGFERQYTCMSNTRNFKVIKPFVKDLNIGSFNLSVMVLGFRISDIWQECSLIKGV